jgi:hypothetical protein
MEHLIRFVVSGELAKCQLCVVRERVAFVSSEWKRAVAGVRI